MSSSVSSSTWHQKRVQLVGGAAPSPIGMGSVM
jgi:hypothetical protein